MIPTLAWTPRRRPLHRSNQAPPGGELRPRRHLRTGGRGHRHHGRPRRSGHRRLRRLRHRPRRHAHHRPHAPGIRTRVRPHLRPPGRNPPHRRQSLLGHRPHEAPLCGPARRRRNSRPNQGKNPRRSPRHVRGRHRRLPDHGRIRRARCCPTKAASSPTATPEPWPPAATAPPWASSAPPSSRASASTSSPTKPVPSCRARASPPGS